MNPEIREALQFCPNLPSLPTIAIRIVRMGNDPDANISDLAALLAQDPALASRVLRVSNSPLYAQRRKSESLRQSAMILGMNATMTLALSFSLADTLRKSQGGRGFGRVWKRALIAALASRQLGQFCGSRALEELHLAGLLQDLGILALEAALPERYDAILHAAGNHDHLLYLERDALGTDHGAAGTWLMRHWGLPDRMARCATEVHEPEHIPPDDPDRRFIQCVALGGRLADILIEDDLEQGLSAAARVALRTFNMEQDAIEPLLDQLVAEIPDIARLFETDLISPQKAMGIIDQAREILATRNLHLIHEAAEHQRKVIEMEMAARKLQETAIRDGLTGLHNRRYFDEILGNEFRLANDNGWPLTIGFLDLDHFKAVNDSHGHLVGDAVLIRVATSLRETLRDGDFIMRYGGEEFVVLLPGKNLPLAQQIFERLRLGIAALAHPGKDGSVFQVTASIGVATHRQDQEGFRDCMELVLAADRALYDAKRKGRNRISCVTCADSA